MAITPGTYNMTVQRRSDHSIQLVFKDSNNAAISLVGFTVEAQVWEETRTTKYADFAVTYTNRATGTIDIDRGGTSVYKLVGNASGAHLVGHVDFQSAGIVLRGTNTADIGLTFTNFTNGLLTLIVHKEH
jgi:hypothetical protein